MSTSTRSGSRAGSGRTYSDAIECLNSLQSNAATINDIRTKGGRGDEFLIPESIDYLKRIGYSPEDLNALSVIHITGTKGKGSTSAFCSSLLRALSPSAKVGLYTSPHLMAVRERIRINGQPLPEDKFAKYFFDVWDRFEQNKEKLYDFSPEKPAYFRYLTTMAFHVFLQEKVDATVLEVGIGGTYDSTNIIPKPITTGITALGIDHIFVLGKTIEAIARQKGGIYKPGVPALTVSQPSTAQLVLQVRAAELKASSFTVVEEHPQLTEVKLGLAGDFQRSNASLAVALVQTFLASPELPAAFSEHRITPSDTPPSQSGQQALISETELPCLSRGLVLPTPLPEVVVQGLEKAHWPGRCQVIKDREPSRKGVTWFLDGAHTVESLQCCGEWFTDAAVSKRRGRQVLVFNCTSGRSGESLLGSLTDSMADRLKGQAATVADDSAVFHDVIFCTNTTYTDGTFSGDLVSKATDEKDLAELTVQHELAEAWRKLASASGAKVSTKTEIHVLPSIQHAVNQIAKRNEEDGSGSGVDVLVTGSLHLIGGVFEVAKLDFAL